MWVACSKQYANISFRTFPFVLAIKTIPNTQTLIKHTPPTSMPFPMELSIDTRLQLYYSKRLHKPLPVSHTHIELLIRCPVSSVYFNGKHSHMLSVGSGRLQRPIANDSLTLRTTTLTHTGYCKHSTQWCIHLLAHQHISCPRCLHGLRLKNPQ